MGRDIWVYIMLSNQCQYVGQVNLRLDSQIYLHFTFDKVKLISLIMHVFFKLVQLYIYHMLHVYIVP